MVETYQISHDKDPVVGNYYKSILLDFHSEQGNIEGAIQIQQHPLDKMGHSINGNNNILQWISVFFK